MPSVNRLLAVIIVKLYNRRGEVGALFAPAWSKRVRLYIK